MRMMQQRKIMKFILLTIMAVSGISLIWVYSSWQVTLGVFILIWMHSYEKHAA